MDRFVVLLKPDVADQEDEIVYLMRHRAMNIVNRRRILLTREQVEEYYIDYMGDEGFDLLLEFMTSGPVVALLVEKAGGIEDSKEFIGPHDPVEAKISHPDSLRAIYGVDVLRNGFYASESHEVALLDIKFFFPEMWIEPLLSKDRAKIYLESSLYPVLTQGLTQLCKEKPENPTTWLGNWLIENNPNKPKVVLP
ncbi:nucleoside diphosphate kinase [Polychytrium aggregatum]|uniref:nucleoside diphosphate kinase n=1 Tax=Polychytrium aggregatum TaxID=110093 RepID=UPI0022FF411D|nr:nucleoside diphosphate kinase [Polychytrium aggregatum]KAI9199236.1 nucleoside diphosphate kinase [Polychytrium aggregatum]